jgi:hypothetical protein
MMARQALVPAPQSDFDDACPTLEIPSPFAPGSGVFPSQPGAQLAAVRPMPAASMDPALSTLHDVVNPEAFSTWQNDRLLAADASLAIRAQGAVARPRVSTAPLPRPQARPVSPDASLLAWQPNATMSPDGTLLPWRHERPPSRRGSVALVLLFAAVASIAATVGFMRSASQPVAITVRVARIPATGVRHLQLVDSAEAKAAPVVAPRPVRRARSATPRAASPLPAATAEAAEHDAVGEGPAE